MIGSAPMRAAFVSGVEPLDRCFREQAGQSQRKLRTTVWVLSASAAIDVPLRYYSLAPFHLAFSECPPSLRRRLPEEPLYVALIAPAAFPDNSRHLFLPMRTVADAARERR